MSEKLRTDAELHAQAEKRAPPTPREVVEALGRAPALRELIHKLVEVSETSPRFKGWYYDLQRRRLREAAEFVDAGCPTTGIYSADVELPDDVAQLLKIADSLHGLKVALGHVGRFLAVAGDDVVADAADLARLAETRALVDDLSERLGVDE